MDHNLAEQMRVRWLEEPYQIKKVECQTLGMIPFSFVTITQQTRAEGAML